MARPWLRTLTACITVALTAACSVQSPQGSIPTSSGAPQPLAATTSTTATLGVEGTALTLDGKPWWPIGLNAYQLGTDWSINAGCGAQVDLDTYFSRLPPHSLTRFNAFSSLAVNKYTGMLDFTALDAVVRAAERHGQMLIAVLSSNEGSCEDDTFKEYGWYTDGWDTDRSPGTTLTFAQWLDTAVKRWAASPAVAGWTAVGEPEPSLCTDDGCT